MSTSNDSTNPSCDQMEFPFIILLQVLALKTLNSFFCAALETIVHVFYKQARAFNCIFNYFSVPFITGGLMVPSL